MVDLFNDWYLFVLIALAIYEGLARLVPTYKNMSLIDFITEILKIISNAIQKFIPNRKKK